jgi:hypothetical protein
MIFNSAFDQDISEDGVFEDLSVWLCDTREDRQPSQPPVSCASVIELKKNPFEFDFTDSTTVHPVLFGCKQSPGS